MDLESAAYIYPLEQNTKALFTQVTGAYHPVAAVDHGLNNLNVEENWNKQRWCH